MLAIGGNWEASYLMNFLILSPIFLQKPIDFELAQLFKDFYLKICVIFQCNTDCSVLPRSCLAKYIGRNRTIQVEKDDMKLLLKSEVDESIDISGEGQLSFNTRERLLKIKSDTGSGPIKIFCDIDHKECKLNSLEFLGFLGTYRILLDANKSERYHGLLVLGDYKII